MLELELKTVVTLNEKRKKWKEKNGKNDLIRVTLSCTWPFVNYAINYLSNTVAKSPNGAFLKVKCKKIGIHFITWYIFKL